MWSKITLVLSLLPKIIAVVKLVDDILDPATEGADKKAYALDIFRKLGVPDNVMPMIGEVLDVVVAVLNFFGLLGRKKSQEEPAVDATVLAPAAAKVRAEVDAEKVAVTDEVFNEFLAATER